MIGLFIKDLRLMKNQCKFYIVILFVAFMFVYTDVELSFLVGYLTFIFSFFTLSTLSYDEFDNGMAFLFTLPFDRKCYVKEKYLFGMLLTGTSWSLASIISVVGAIYKNDSENINNMMLANLGILVAVLFVFAIVLPLEFKYGSEKGRITIFIVFGCIYLIGFCAAMAAKKFDIDVTKIINKISTVNDVFLIVMVCIVSAVMLLISYIISIGVIKKKEY